MNEWVMDVPHYGLIRVSKDLIVRLLSYRQLDLKTPESGGVLIGKHLNSNGKILIDGFTPPQPTDKQEQYTYYRSSIHHELVQAIWKESQYKTTYIGLWHTHAEPIPCYSSVDKADWMNTLNFSKFEGNLLLFFIIGQTHIRCWMGTKHLFRNKIDLIGEYNAALE